MRAGNEERSREALSIDTRHISLLGARVLFPDELRAWLVKLIHRHYGSIRRVRDELSCSNGWIYERLRDLNLWPEVIAARHRRAHFFGASSVSRDHYTEISHMPNASRLTILYATKPQEARSEMLLILREAEGDLHVAAGVLRVQYACIYRMIVRMGLLADLQSIRLEAKQRR